MNTIIKTIGSDDAMFWSNSGIIASQFYPRTKIKEFDTSEGTSKIYDGVMLYVLPDIQLKDVESVYIGTPGKCMCGCSGHYSYTSINRDAAGKSRGYAISDKDVNDKRVQYVINRLAKNAPAGIEYTNGHIYQQVIGQTQYDIYLRE